MNTALEYLLPNQCVYQNTSTQIVVVEPYDSENDLIDARRFSSLVCRLNGLAKEPNWDSIEKHTGWWDLIYTVLKEGFDFLLLLHPHGIVSLAGFPAQRRALVQMFPSTSIRFQSSVICSRSGWPREAQPYLKVDLPALTKTVRRV